MLPGGLAAAAFVLSLIPGWLFLRCTDRTRKPRHQSALHELLEVVAVGLATSGASVLFWIRFRSDAIFELLRAPANSRELQHAAWAVAIVLATACGLALVAAAAVTARTEQHRYSVGVWWEVLTKENIPDKHTAHVAIRLADGTTVDGPLHAYTWSEAATNRDVSLEAPIRFTNAKGAINTQFNRVIVPGSGIQHLSVRYTPKFGLGPVHTLSREQEPPDASSG